MVLKYLTVIMVAFPLLSCETTRSRQSVLAVVTFSDLYADDYGMEPTFERASILVDGTRVGVGAEGVAKVAARLDQLPAGARIVVDNRARRFELSAPSPEVSEDLRAASARWKARGCRVNVTGDDPFTDWSEELKRMRDSHRHFDFDN